jgi:predicted ferric reductase
MYIAVIALVFAYLHNLLKEIYFSDSLQTTIGNMSLLTFAAISIFSILLMINRLCCSIKVVDSFRRFLNNTLRIKYENKVLIHNLFVLSLIILLVHVLMSSSVEGNTILRIILVAYFIIPMFMYLNRKIIRAYFGKDGKYTISDIIYDAKNIITLKLKPTNGRIFNYLPGQFAYIRIYNPGIPHDEHPFTISSSPSQKEYVSLTIKQLGDFSSSINKVKIGDKAYLDGGYGGFSYLKDTEAKKLCFIAGGIGITPFLSMLKYMASDDRNCETLLLWGVRDKSEIICDDELEKYKSILKSFKFVPVISNEKEYEGETGYIDIDKIQRYIGDMSDYDFYICGPPIMLDMQLKNLKALGVKKEIIHFERFSV